MSRAHFGRLVLGGALLLTVALAARVALWRPLPVAGTAPPEPRHHLQGVLHVHTTLSDGGGTLDEVERAARAAGLDFVFVTDHNHLAGKQREGLRDGLLVGVGTELSTTGGHLLALGLPDPATFRFGGEPDQALDDARLLGAATFAAHPINARAELNWTAWSLPGPWGLEIFNGDSQWRSAGLGSLLLTAAQYALNPRRALLGSVSPPGPVLARWDELLARRDVPAITGADAHSRVPLTRRRGLRFPGYEPLFEVSRMHVLLEHAPPADAPGRLSALVEALRRGRGYLALDGLAPAGGFFFEARAGGRTWAMGDTVAPAPDLRLVAGGRLPEAAELVLLLDGKALSSARGGLDVPAPGPGVYRVEARLPGWPAPWVISNPVYVFGPEAAARRAAAGAWPVPAPAPPAGLTLDDFEGASAFRPEKDPASRLVADLGRVGEGPGGSRAARLDFRLGRPEEGGPPHGWCALVRRGALDLAGRRGLLLSLRADGVYRLWLQVRDANPQGSDDGSETWLTSLRTSTEWQRLALPVERFRSLDPHSDGRLDLSRVTALGLVLDDLTVPPGTQGTLWIDDLGAY